MPASSLFLSLINVLLIVPSNSLMNISDKKLASIRTKCYDFFSHSWIFKLFRKVFKLT